MDIDAKAVQACDGGINPYGAVAPWAAIVAGLGECRHGYVDRHKIFGF